MQTRTSGVSGRFSLADGEFLVRTARKAIEDTIQKKPIELGRVDEKFEEKRGVFVSLHSKKGELRGCIGYPRPVHPLVGALCDAAVSAALRDDRFPHVRWTELGGVVVEVTVLTQPELIKKEGETISPEEICKKIEVGKHGLMIEAGPFSGLLLPQVATELGCDAADFLAQTCLKAGVDPSAWLDPKAKVYRFEGQIFTEETPNGRVVEKKV